MYQRERERENIIGFPGTHCVHVFQVIDIEIVAGPNTTQKLCFNIASGSTFLPCFCTLKKILFEATDLLS